ncbi:MAG: DNA mismatch repair protein MutS, partial [Alphaproteobacteria bacterium]|nr:DNA mismatch repair protein MutS [Alphaproteobacteria bacterium]
MNDMSDREGGLDGRATPVMAQYLRLKEAHRDCLLFYRMGDFYELFFADAEAAARDLGIALTRRGKHLGEDIPMCGVPVHTADSYLQRLIRKGHRVAICEQLEDPAEARKRGSKAVVRRDVVRLVTPGTLTEDSLLDSRAHNYLAALARVRDAGELALAWTDISAGELTVAATGEQRLAADLARLEPRELIVPESLLADAALAAILANSGAALTPLPASRFDSASGERRLCQHFAVATLDSYGAFTRAEVSALGGLLDYVMLTQVGKLPHLRPPRREEPRAALLIDGATRANLELMRTLSGERQGSLNAVIDLTVTAAGARALSARLASPSADAGTVNGRLDDVEFLLAGGDVRRTIRDDLARLPDIERALARLTVGRGGPRDLASLRDGLSGSLAIAAGFAEGTDLAGLPAGLSLLRNRCGEADRELRDRLQAVLADELPAFVRDGGFVRGGYQDELDQA